MRNVLVTGGAGFIGSNFVLRMIKKHADWRIVNVDALTYAGNMENLASLKDEPRHVFVQADILDRGAMQRLFDKYHIDMVVNFAAESHVDRSIEDPAVFLRTNVIGTQTLLDAAKEHWKSAPWDKYSREFRAGVRFLQVSTDEVYGALGPTGSFTEKTPLAPNSPYAASKAAADLCVRAYHETFGLPVNITRCSNNYGPYQFPEKLIPLMIHNSLHDKPLPVYGDGMQVRDWLYVTDHCDAIDAVLEQGAPGEVYNIGGNNERANLQIIERILAVTGKPATLITHVKDRPGHDRRYAIDSTKITEALGWQPQVTFEQGMADTIAWYLDHTAWTDAIVSGEYQTYYQRMYR